MTVDDLCGSLREKGVYDLSAISLAVVETNGRVSIYSCRDKQSFSPDGAVPLPVVNDGRPCSWAIAACGLTETWIVRQIEQKGLSLSDVLLMTADKAGRHVIVPKEKNP